MPNRILRDWTDSEAIDKLSWQAEVLFIRLIMKADDYGCYHGNAKLLKSLLFPLKDGMRESDISRWLTELSSSGLIRFYLAEEKPFIEIRKYGQRLKLSRHKFPKAPDETDVSSDFRELPGTSRNFPSEENRNRNRNGGDIAHACAEIAPMNLNHPSNPEEVVALARSYSVPITVEQAKDFIMKNEVTAQGGTWMCRNVPVRDWRKLMNSRWLEGWREDNKRNRKQNGSSKHVTDNPEDFNDIPRDVDF